MLLADILSLQKNGYSLPVPTVKYVSAVLWPQRAAVRAFEHRVESMDVNPLNDAILKERWFSTNGASSVPVMKVIMFADTPGACSISLSPRVRDSVVGWAAAAAAGWRCAAHICIISRSRCLPNEDLSKCGNAKLAILCLASSRLIYVSPHDWNETYDRARWLHAAK